MPRLRESAFRFCGWSLFAKPEKGILWADTIRRQFSLAHELEKKSLISIVRNSEDLLCRENDPLKILLHLEGCFDLETLDREELYEQGLRSLSLTWNEKNIYATGTSLQNDQQEGLTRKGKELLKWCRDNKVIVDISHLSEGGVHDVFRFDDAPLVATHANARALCDHPRNLSDDTLREIGRRKGCVGLTLVPEFLTGSRNCNSEALRPHLEHVLDISGEDALCSGSDLDGTRLPDDLKDVCDWSRKLKDFQQDFPKSFQGENMLRFIEKVFN
jgi:membrane dipeptidase